MNRFRRRYRRTTDGSMYAPARHRLVDASHAAALAEVGNSCQNVAPASNNVTAADNSAPKAAVLTFHGDLDVSKKKWIETTLGAIERFAPATVAIVDLTDVQYLDTTFLNALLRAERLTRSDAGSRPRIVAPARSMPSRIFAITKLDALFDVFEDLVSAHR